MGEVYLDVNRYVACGSSVRSRSSFTERCIHFRFELENVLFVWGGWVGGWIGLLLLE